MGAALASPRLCIVTTKSVLEGRSSTTMRPAATRSESTMGTPSCADFDASTARFSPICQVARPATSRSRLASSCDACSRSRRSGASPLRQRCTSPQRQRTSMSRPATRYGTSKPAAAPTASRSTCSPGANRKRTLNASPTSMRTPVLRSAMRCSGPRRKGQPTASAMATPANSTATAPAVIQRARRPLRRPLPAVNLDATVSVTEGGTAMTAFRQRRSRTLGGSLRPAHRRPSPGPVGMRRHSPAAPAFSYSRRRRGLLPNGSVIAHSQ